MTDDLSDVQLHRYSRQIILQHVGSSGMEDLLKSTVTIIGAGGLGCPAAQILAAVGVGNLRLVDRDRVDISNLPRQVLHHTADIGLMKVQSVKEKINAMNPDVNVSFLDDFATKENIASILEGSDYVIEASDNIATKFLVNDACVHFRIPFTIAGVVEFYGQVVSVVPGETTCYRCIFQEIGDPDELRTCSGAGVMGTVPSFAGLLQANEAIKSILGKGVRFVNGMFNFDLFENSFDFLPIRRDPSCAACSHPERDFYNTQDYGDNEPSCATFFP